MRQKNKIGFTLIETLVYLALYAIIIGGSLSALYAIIESDDLNQTTAMIQEEGAFLIGKIDWMLSRARSVQSPINTGSTLTVIVFDGSIERIRLFNDAMEMQKDSSVFERLNNSNVYITSLVFAHTTASTNAFSAESLEAKITVSATTSTGRLLKRDFSTIKYLRK